MVSDGEDEFAGVEEFGGCSLQAGQLDRLKSIPLSFRKCGRALRAWTKVGAFEAS